MEQIKICVSEKEQANCNNVTKQYLKYKKENIKEYNPNWPQIPDHPYRIFTIESSGSGKTNW